MSVSLGKHLTTSQLLIVDSWPVMEWFKERQPITDIFEAVLDRASSSALTLVMSNINLGEVFYNCWNEWGEERANEAVSILRSLPIQMMHPTPSDVLEAARIKAMYRCSYADAFAVILGIVFSGAVLTGDPDFLKLRQRAVVDVAWIGK